MCVKIMNKWLVGVRLDKFEEEEKDEKKYI